MTAEEVKRVFCCKCGIEIKNPREFEVVHFCPICYRKEMKALRKIK
jgi:NMD protein affecting ribosome stability and mRNA decay